MSGADRSDFYHHAASGRGRPPHSVADISPMIPILTEPGPAGGPNGKPARKRSRVSKKSTTTLLNTDAANFRAMVQQFTGAPAAPYTSGYTSGGRTQLPTMFENPTGQPEILLRQYEYQPPPYKQVASGFPMIGNMEDGLYGGAEINSGEVGGLVVAEAGFFVDGPGGEVAAGMRTPEDNHGGAYFY